MEEHEEKEQRHTRDNIRIQHGDIIQELYRLFSSAAEVVDAYSGQRAQNRADQRCYERYHDRVFQGLKQRRRIGCGAGEQRLIKIESESGPVAQRLRLGEREDRDENYRRVDHQKYQPQIGFGHNSCPSSHTVAPPSTVLSFLLPGMRVVTPMMISIMNDRAAP